MLLGRFLTLFFGVTSALGVLWFTDSLDYIVITSTTVSIIAALTVSMTPGKVYRKKRSASFLLATCIVGIIAVVIVIAHDILKYGLINQTSIFYQLIFIVGFILIAKEIVNELKRLIRK